ncbi:hypothetical protein FRC15_002968 [Serendipita sp. 397]|nr:hypothetical protein FRC15_002968 [Serendipita sp. 397]
MKEYRKLDDFVTMRMNRNGALFREVPRPSSFNSTSSTMSNDDPEACLYFWKQLVANWKSRAEIIDYCVKVVDQNLEQKERTLNELVDTQNSASSNNTRLFDPSRPVAEYWRGPSNEFYRPVQHPSHQPPSHQPPTSPASSTSEGEKQTNGDNREKYNAERRRKEEETDTRNSIWEERVKRDQIMNEKTVEAIVRRRSYEAFRSRCKFFEPPSHDPWWDEVSKSRSFRP